MTTDAIGANIAKTDNFRIIFLIFDLSSEEEDLRGIDAGSLTFVTLSIDERVQRHRSRKYSPIKIATKVGIKTRINRAVQSLSPTKQTPATNEASISFENKNKDKMMTKGIDQAEKW